MVDYARKSRVMALGLHKKISKIDKLTYLDAINGVERNEKLDDEYFNLCMQYDYADIKEARKINTATYQRTKRLRSRIRHLLELGNCLFLTYTFTDETFSKTNQETRKKYVKRHLNEFCPGGFVANIDYGKLNEREHYHALVLADKVDGATWKYGNLDFERLRLKGEQYDKTLTRIPKYINKLTNHAIKETTKQCRIIYSKKIKKMPEKSASIKDDIILSK